MVSARQTVIYYASQLASGPHTLTMTNLNSNESEENTLGFNRITVIQNSEANVTTST